MEKRNESLAELSHAVLADPRLAPIVADVLAARGASALVVRGEEGLDELSVAGPSQVWEVRDGAVPDADAWPDPILLDSWSPDQRGGTGRTWDWRAARALLERRRVIVAGGLGPENVGEVVRSFRPHGVDVSSGVERAIRVKDGDLIRAFVQAVRDADMEMIEA